jgi:hypothetical protein
MFSRKLLLLSGLLSFFLVGCGSIQTETTPVEVETLRQYIQALAEKNETVYSRLICPDWESEAYLEFDAYKGMQSRLGEMTCRRVSIQDGSAKVNCQGKIMLSYGTEQQEIDLSSRIYHLTTNGNAWQVCGFTTS